MRRDTDYALPILSRGRTTFFSSRGNSVYTCRLGCNDLIKVKISDAEEEAMKIFSTKWNDAIQSDQVRCSQRHTIFDIYLKVLPPTKSPTVTRPKLVCSIHGRIFRQLIQEMHLQRPLQLKLTIRLGAPLLKTVVTDYMTFVSDPRDKLWPKAFTFSTELEDLWDVPCNCTPLAYKIVGDIYARPFIQSAVTERLGLGIVPQFGDGETALMNKKSLEKRVHCDFTLVSGNGEHRVTCHKLFLDGLSGFFDRVLQSGKNECKLEGSSKEGLDALLKFLYYRNVEDAVDCCAVAYELHNLGYEYDIARLEDTMEDLLLAKLDDWWDLEVALRLFYRIRLLEDDNGWQPLKRKAEEVLKMRRSELMSDSNTLFNDLWVKDHNAAKELMRLLTQQDDSD